MSRTRSLLSAIVLALTAGTVVTLWAAGARATAGGPPPGLTGAMAATATPPPPGGQEGSVQITVSIAPKPTGSATASPSRRPTAPPTTRRPPRHGDNPLPRTGVALIAVLATGAALVGAGSALRYLARRRHSSAGS